MGQELTAKLEKKYIAINGDLTVLELDKGSGVTIGNEGTRKK